MIRLFYAFGKSLFNKTSDLVLFNEASTSFSLEDFVCPKCGTTHSCTERPTYPRYLISFEMDNLITHSIDVRQVQCSSCLSIHAILPDCLIPHSSYSLSFVLTVLRAHFLSSCTVESLCLRFQISTSTLYAWIRLFFKHKRLWLGLLQDSELSVYSFLNNIYRTFFSTRLFFNTYHFSFLQYAFTTRFDSS